MNEVYKRIIGTIKLRRDVDTSSLTKPGITRIINSSIEKANKRNEEEMRKGHNRLPNFGRIGKSSRDEEKSTGDER